MSTQKPELHFFHGFLGDPCDWDPLRSHLTGYHSFSHDILEIPALKKPSILIGYSMGGRAILQTYRANIQHVKGMVFLSSNLGTSSLKDKKTRKHEEGLWIEKSQQEGIDSFIKWWYEKPLFAPFKASPFYHQVEARRRKNTHSTIVNQLNRFSLARTENWWEKISEITIPLYFLFGEHDTKYDRIYKKCCSLPKACIPKSGHVLHLEAPAECAHNIKQFVEVNYD